MSIKKWYTHPAESYDSFYYYDTRSRNMVRIRLQLERYDGGPEIVARQKRYIGFYDPNSGEHFHSSMQYWSVDDRERIVYTNGNIRMVLPEEPRVGWVGIDFSLDGSEERAHRGNKVTNTSNLPDCATDGRAVTEDTLEEIAQRWLGEHRNQAICEPHVDKYTLANELVKLC